MITDKNEAVINKILDIIDSKNSKNSPKKDLINHLKKGFTFLCLKKKKWTNLKK